MKNKILRALLPVFLVSFSIIGIQSCSNDTSTENKSEDPKKVAEEHNDAKFNNDSTEKDAQFLVNAAEINLEEIQLGQLAQKSGTMQHVKDLGKMMEDDHSKALTELKALAAKKNITIPASLTEDGQDAYKKLSDKKGKDFDKDFADKMVDGHKAAIDKFEKAASDAKDPDIKAWAASMLPGLRTHLDHSKAVKDECDKMK